MQFVITVLLCRNLSAPVATLLSSPRPSRPKDILMTNVSVAGWIRQNASSPTGKVYGALTWTDPTDGSVRFFTLYGQGRHLGSSLTVNDERATAKAIRTVHDAQREFANRLATKENRGYTVGLGGPTVVEVDESLLGNANRVLDQFDGTIAAVDAESAAATALTTTATAAAAVTAPPAAVSTATATKVQPVTLPTGDLYYPRLVGGIADVELLRTARSSGLMVGLQGPPGSGKTTLPIAAFADLVTVQAHGDLTVADLVGKFVPDNASPSGFAWRDGPLTIAMLEGRVLLVDEITRAPSETLAALLSATDTRRSLIIDDQPGRTIQAAPSFYVVIAYNVEGQGVRPLDEALKRRFPIRINVETDYDAAARKGVGTKLITVARNLKTKSAQAVANGQWATWVPQMATLLDVQSALDAGFGDDIATGMLLGACTDDDPTAVSDTIAAVFGCIPNPLALGAAA